MVNRIDVQLDIECVEQTLIRRLFLLSIDWLEETNENDVLNGKQEAYCKLCKCHLRAHHSDLIAHKKSNKHCEKEQVLDRKTQSSMHGTWYIIILYDSSIIYCV